MAAAKLPFQIALKTHRCCDPLCPELLFYLDIYSLESDAMTETAEGGVICNRLDYHKLLEKMGGEGHSSRTHSLPDGTGHNLVHGLRPNGALGIG